MTKKLNARNAWIFPLICWVISIGTALIRLNLGGIVNLILALAELVLLISAFTLELLYFQIKRVTIPEKKKFTLLLDSYLSD